LLHGSSLPRKEIPGAALKRAPSRTRGHRGLSSQTMTCL
jgi:hypothetical protein